MDLQAEKEKTYEDLLSCQTSLRAAEAERRVWKAKADDLEAELLNLRNKLKLADSKFGQFEEEKEVRGMGEFQTNVK